jgi:hypothetical protein
LTFRVTDLDTSNVSRRCDAAKQKAEAGSKLAYAKDLVEKKYRERIAGLTSFFTITLRSWTNSFNRKGEQKYEKSICFDVVFRGHCFFTK